MSSPARYFKGADAIPHAPVSAVSGGALIQLPDGRAALVPTAVVAGEWTEPQVRGLVWVAKTASIVMLPGQRAYLDVSAQTATYKRDAGTQDFYLGSVAQDAAADDAEVLIDLNAIPANLIDLRAGRGEIDDEATLGLGATRGFDEIITLAFDAVAEVAQAAIVSGVTFPANKGWIFEAEVAIYNIGDAAALDINVGVANASHASDMDAATESALFHFDGNDLSAKCESDDGTTEVNAQDSTVDLVDDVYALLQIDARDNTNIKFYINGVRAVSGSTFKLNAATGPLKALVHLEKTSDDTVADVRVRELFVRTCEPTTAA